MHHETFYRVAARFVPLAVAITGIAGMVYIAEQQSYRQVANDPQIQMAEDAGRAFAAGAIPNELLNTSAHIDIAQSLTPYLVVYSEEGNPVTGTGYLDGALPSLPAGVFAYTKAHGEDRISWQPKSGVRSAVVLVHYQGEQQSGFVLAGRSLRETEMREAALLRQVFLPWLVTMIASFLMAWVFL